MGYVVTLLDCRVRGHDCAVFMNNIAVGFKEDTTLIVFTVREMVVYNRFGGRMEKGSEPKLENAWMAWPDVEYPGNLVACQARGNASA